MQSIGSFFGSFPSSLGFNRTTSSSSTSSSSSSSQLATTSAVAESNLALFAAAQEKALQAIQADNIFSSRQEKEQALEMASFAKMAYAEKCPSLSHCSTLPSAQSLGITLPAGLMVQAFRHRGRVIIAIRGTELKKDMLTMIKNLIADAGIGRHKSNEDLISSLEKVNQLTSTLYGFKLDEGHLNMVKSLIQGRVKGDTEAERAKNILSRVLSAGINGAGKWSLGGAATGAAAGGTMAAATLTTGGMALLVGGVITTVSASAGFAVNSTIETVKCLTVADGYPALLSYVKAIDAYIMTLKEHSYFTEADTVVTVGHSLGGYLAGVVGAIHSDEIYSFNGPGVNFDGEMKALIQNLGIQRAIRDNVTYHSISMKADFIGNLTSRTGSMRQLSIPHALDNHAYSSPLAFHGIDLMERILGLSSVSSLPREPSGPQIEVLPDDDENKSQ
jgi:hypothetical protein